MSVKVVHLEPDEHIAVQQLLPWYVSCRLEADEKTEVSKHLASCAACRLEFDIERRRQRQWQRVEVDESASSELAAGEAGWSAMRMRIDAADADADADGAAATLARGLGRPKFSRRTSGGRSSEPRHRWWRRALPALLSVALASVLGFNLYSQPGPRGEFHTLAAPAADGAQVLVRFRPEASESQIRRSLNDSGGRLVDGPTVEDAYVVRLPRDRYRTSLELLRRNPAVLLVEALDPIAKP